MKLGFPCLGASLSPINVTMHLQLSWDSNYTLHFASLFTYFVHDVYAIPGVMVMASGVLAIFLAQVKYIML